MEREEGELTDEDLEDVSDNSSELSIPIAFTGKSSPLREPFRELSLTSISDDSDSSLLAKQAYRHISRDLYRKHSHKHRHRQDGPPPSPSKRARKFPDKRNKRRNSIHRKDYSSVSSSSDDSSNYKNKTILRQLRDAVRINRSQNLPNCSLRTRLKRMIEPASGSASQTSHSSDDDNLEILRDQALQSKTRNDTNAVKHESTEETNVPDEDLAQLRLIALKSAVIKKHAERRKRKEEQLKQQQLQQQEEEKPQDTSNNQEQPTNENPDNNKSIEEDEDILRAMLLTSISKKIADKKTQPLPNKPNSKPLNGLTTQQKPNENNYTLPVNNAPINRFIIKVNSDSESDSEQNETTNKKLINSHNHNPKNDIFDKSLSLFLQQARAKTEQDKAKHHQSDISDISHLPRSQQIEYKRLKRKLQILSTRMNQPNKIKKLATNVTSSDENKKILTNTNVNVNSNKNVVVSAQHGVTEKTRKDERLMIKGKYEELTPLMSRVSDARNARDKTQAEVKRLINNLRIARAQLTANHQEYTVLVQQLVKAKADIDKRAELQLKLKQKKMIKLNTSTPKKLLNVHENNVVAVTNEQTIIPPPQQQQQQLKQEEQKQLEDEQKLQQPELELETKAEPEINEIQMNDDIMDIDENVPEIDIKKEATILKYNSPLEHIQISRKQPLQNPLLELCPYDLLGVCRDADCLYQHCGVNNTTNTITN